MYFASSSYFFIDRNVVSTRQHSELFIKTTLQFSKYTSTIINYYDRSSKSKSTVPNLLVTPTRKPDRTTSEDRHTQTSSKHNVNMQSTLFSTNSTTNTIHKVIDKRNCSATKNIFGETKPVTADAISTVNINQISTHLFHIKKTFIKHDSKTTNNQKQKSQG